MLTDIDPRSLERAIGELKIETAARLDGLASGLEARATSAELEQVRQQLASLPSRFVANRRAVERRIDATAVKDATIDLANYRVTLVLANGSPGPTFDLMPLFQRFYDENNMGSR